MFQPKDFEPWVVMETSRSGGPGGQNVNKVETRVRLTLALETIPFLGERQKQSIMNDLRVRASLDSLGRIAVLSQRFRSQLQNREDALEKLSLLLAQALHERLKRKKTKPTHGSKATRLQTKKRHSAKKAGRKTKLDD